MLTLVLGIILLIAPFLLLGLFSNKTKGFVCILFFLLIYQSVLAILIQGFGIFYYWVAIGLTLLPDLVVLFLCWRFREKLSFKISDIDWIFFVVALTAILTLYQVHYNYTGKISLVSDAASSYHSVRNMNYPYPYYSDEWSDLSLIKGAIDFHGLPIKSSLSDGFFINIEILFSSLLAETFLILGVNPILTYNFIAILFNVLIISLSYLFLRKSNIPKLISAISSLSILYITCASNLPGIWYLIPMHLGILFCLIEFCFLSVDSFWLAFGSAIASLLFYTPLFLFSGFGLFVFAFYKYPAVRKNISKIIWCSLAALIVAIIVGVLIAIIFSLAELLNFGISKLFYLSFTGNLVPQYNPFYVLPIFVIIFGAIGIPFVFKNRRWLFCQLALGIFFWLLYAFTIHRFIIEYQRDVFFTSIIICLISGFGLQQLEKYISSKIEKIKFPILKYLESLAIIAFLIFIPFYTRQDSWQKFILKDYKSPAIGYPKAPANNYLTDDDLQIFKNINGKKFLSLPWKGLVVGVATGNYPIVTKGSTITIGSESNVTKFLNSDCAAKTKMVKDWKADYVYLYDFSCPGFEKLLKSKEGLTLYKVE